MESETTGTYREIPKDYGRKVFVKTVYGGNSKDSENNAQTLLRNRQNYGMEERSSMPDSKIEPYLRRLKGKETDSQKGNSIIERIILNDRQIVLKLEPGKLSVYAELNDGTKVGYHGKEVVREFAPGLSLRVLSNARNAILSGLQSLEKNCRKEELSNQLNHYFTTFPGMLYIVPQRDDISLNSETLENAVVHEENPILTMPKKKNDSKINSEDVKNILKNWPEEKREPAQAELRLLKEIGVSDSGIQEAYLKQVA